MFVLIENYTDEFDTYCRMKGSFKSIGDAQAAMRSLLESAKKCNKEYEMLYDCWDDMARIEWECIPNEYEWYIFEVKCD